MKVPLLFLEEMSSGVYYTEVRTIDREFLRDFHRISPLSPNYLDHIFSKEEYDISPLSPIWQVGEKVLPSETIIIYKKPGDLIEAINSGKLLHLNGPEAFRAADLYGKRGQLIQSRITEKAKLLEEEFRIIRESTIRRNGFEQAKFLKKERALHPNPFKMYHYGLDTMKALILAEPILIVDNIAIKRFKYIAALNRFDRYFNDLRIKYIICDGKKITPIAEMYDLPQELIESVDPSGRMLLIEEDDLVPNPMLTARYFVPNPDSALVTKCTGEFGSIPSSFSINRFKIVPSYQTVPLQDNFEILNAEQSKNLWKDVLLSSVGKIHYLLHEFFIPECEGFFLCERSLGT